MIGLLILVLQTQAQKNISALFNQIICYQLSGEEEWLHDQS